MALHTLLGQQPDELTEPSVAQGLCSGQRLRNLLLARQRGFSIPVLEQGSLEPEILSGLTESRSALGSSWCPRCGFRPSSVSPFQLAAEYEHPKTQLQDHDIHILKDLAGRRVSADESEKTMQEPRLLGQQQLQWLTHPVVREAQGWRHTPGPVASWRHFIRAQPYLLQNNTGRRTLAKDH